MLRRRHIIECLPFVCKLYIFCFISGTVLIHYYYWTGDLTILIHHDKRSGNLTDANGTRLPISHVNGDVFEHKRMDKERYNGSWKLVYQAGNWSSDFVSSYHKHYDVNCSAIFSGDEQAIQNASQMISSKPSVEYPSDDEVAKWMTDCQDYRRKRRYPEVPKSQEEADYPVAYIFTVHKDAAQVERLFRAVYEPHNVYCFHVDKKAPEGLHMAIRKLISCFDNAFVASKLEDVQYRGFTRLKADLNCMSDLMPKKWKYVINLCGQDFPLKTNLEIVRQLKALEGRNDMPGVFPAQNKWFVERTLMHHEFINGAWRKTDKKKPPPPHSALMYFGSAYYAATREFVEYVLRNKTATDLLEYLSDSNSPDEHYWVTVNKYPGAPGGFPESTWASNIRFIKWSTSTEYPPCVGKYVRAVCVIGTGYLPYVASRPHLFMNKIHYDYDPIPMQCMEELLDYRSKVPESIKDFVKDYPVTNLFQVSPDHKPAHLYSYMEPIKQPAVIPPSNSSSNRTTS